MSNRKVVYTSQAQPFNELVIRADDAGGVFLEMQDEEAAYWSSISLSEDDLRLLVKDLQALLPMNTTITIAADKISLGKISHAKVGGVCHV